MLLFKYYFLNHFNFSINLIYIINRTRIAKDIAICTKTDLGKINERKQI